MFSQVNLDGILSLFIFCIEFILLLNLLFFADRNRTNRLAMLMIFVLAAYQFFEFLICNRVINSSMSAYIAFVNLSMLPPIGLIMVLAFYNKLAKRHYLVFLPAAILLLYYATMISDFKVVKCSFFYAMYNYPLGDLYGLIYYTPVLATIYYLVKIIKENKNDEKAFLSKVLVVGYLLFLIPSIIAAILYPEFLKMIESVMCKFAFVFACCLSYFVLKNGELRVQLKLFF